MAKFLRESLGVGGSITSTGLGWRGAGSWLLNWDFPSVLNGNRKGSCSAIALFALCSGQPEKLFQNEFIRQKPSKNQGDEREREKDELRPGIYLQGWEEALGKRDVAREL